MKRMLGVIFFLQAAFLFSAEDLRADFNYVRLISVTDGDTLKVNINCRKKVFCKKIPVRVLGIDAPELKSRDACESAKALEAKTFAEEFFKNKKIVLKNCGRDKYFRLLCNVFSADGQGEINFADSILSAGLAVKYTGGTKQKTNWCSFK